jgi:hypothetical protein
MAEIRRNLRQRFEHETAFRHPWVRDLQLRRIDDRAPMQ